MDNILTENPLAIAKDVMDDTIILDVDAETAKGGQRTKGYRKSTASVRKTEKVARKEARATYRTTVVGDQMTVKEEVLKHRPKKLFLADSWLWACWSVLPYGKRSEALKVLGLQPSASHTIIEDPKQPNPDKDEFWFYRPGLDCWGGEGQALDTILSNHHAINLLKSA